jgi:arylsulfatase A-like enzyme
MYLSFNAVHTPMHAREDDLAAVAHIGKPRRRQLAAMTRSLDRAVGTVLDALDETGVADDTLVVFINDNGGATNNASMNTPLRGTKGTPFEGGIRVPFLVRWPAEIPAGGVLEEPVSALDVVPTVLAAAGVHEPPPKPLDGVDLLPYLSGEKTGRPHDMLLWRRGSNLAIRDGDWKLLSRRGGPPMLFDLSRDEVETHDLADAEPETVQRLLAAHRAWAEQLAEPRWQRRAAAVSSSTGPESPVDRPNILWIIAEDLGPELSCYGTQQVWTPNLDRLAEQGVRYTRAFTTAPVCSASRSAFMTGMYQTTIGAHNHRSHRDDGYRLPEGVRLLTDRLRDAGYFTANVRHLTGEQSERFLRGTGKTDWNFHHTGEPFESDRWSDLRDHQPFHAQVNFAETHRGAAWNNASQHIERAADPELVDLPPYYPDRPLTRRDWADYLNAIMALDRKVGFVLQRLEDDGLAENTIVFFLADNGRAMLRGKQWCYDSGLRIPLLVRWPAGARRPAGYQPGAVGDRLIAAIDLAATTLAMAGVTPSPTMQGRVFLGERSDPPRRFVFGARDRCDETVFRIRTVRSARYRYIRNFMPERPFLQLNRYKEWSYPVIGLMRQLHERGELGPPPAVLLAPERPAEELYDLETDPHEVHNLAGSPDHREVLDGLAAVLDAWLVETNDQGRFPEAEEVVEAWERRMQRTYDQRLHRRDAAQRKSPPADPVDREDPMW